MRTKILLGVLAIVVAAAIGRWTAPEKVRIETKIVEKEVKQVDKNEHKVTVVVEHKEKDGSSTTTTTVTDDTNKHSTDQKVSETDQLKEVTKSSSKLTLSVLGGAPLSLGLFTPVYGGMVSKEILGPISIGVWGLSSKEAGVALGVSF